MAFSVLKAGTVAPRAPRTEAEPPRATGGQGLQTLASVRGTSKTRPEHLNLSNSLALRLMQHCRRKVRRLSLGLQECSRHLGTLEGAFQKLLGTLRSFEDCFDTSPFTMTSPPETPLPRLTLRL